MAFCHALLFVFCAGRFTRVLAAASFSPWCSSRHCCWLPPVPGWHSKRATATQATGGRRNVRRTRSIGSPLVPGQAIWNEYKRLGSKNGSRCSSTRSKSTTACWRRGCRVFPPCTSASRICFRAFPSAAVIRAVADGKVPLPSDRVERAIYQNQVAAYEEKRQKQAQEAAQTAGR